MALLTDQFRIFTANKFIKALEGPDPIQSDTDAGSARDRLYVFIAVMHGNTVESMND